MARRRHRSTVEGGHESVQDRARGQAQAKGRRRPLARSFTGSACPSVSKASILMTSVSLLGDVAQVLPCDRDPRLEIPVDVISAADWGPAQPAPRALYDPFHLCRLAPAVPQKCPRHAQSRLHTYGFLENRPVLISAFPSLSGIRGSPSVRRTDSLCM